MAIAVAFTCVSKTTSKLHSRQIFLSFSLFSHHSAPHINYILVYRFTFHNFFLLLLRLRRCSWTPHLHGTYPAPIVTFNARSMHSHQCNLVWCDSCAVCTHICIYSDCNLIVNFCFLPTACFVARVNRREEKTALFGVFFFAFFRNSFYVVTSVQQSVRLDMLVLHRCIPQHIQIQTK